MGVEPTAARKRPAADVEDREAHRDLTTPTTRIPDGGSFDKR
jgi:hypothetical protein